MKQNRQASTRGCRVKHHQSLMQLMHHPKWKSTSHCADNLPLTHAAQVMFRWAESPPDCTVIYVFAFSSLPTLTLRIIILSRVMNVLRGYIKWLNNRKQTFLLTPHAVAKKLGVWVLYVLAFMLCYLLLPEEQSLLKLLSDFTAPFLFIHVKWPNNKLATIML